VGENAGSEVALALAAMAAETRALSGTVDGSVADTLARWLAARYA